jgi:hypothetical protein
VKRFVLAPQAAQDLDDIWEDIAEDNLDAADSVLGKLYENIISWLRLQGWYAMVQFDSSFQQKAEAVETITLVEDGNWRGAGSFIQ